MSDLELDLLTGGIALGQQVAGRVDEDTVHVVVVVVVDAEGEVARAVGGLAAQNDTNAAIRQPGCLFIEGFHGEVNLWLRPGTGFTVGRPAALGTALVGFVCACFAWHGGYLISR